MPVAIDRATYAAIGRRTDRRLVVCNTMVKHAIAAGEYNARRRECDAAVRALCKRLPYVRALRDVTEGDLEEHQDVLAEPLNRRARHVVTENARVAALGRALQQADVASVGRLMLESQTSLREDYAVSCKELDLMVTSLRLRLVLSARG